MKKRLLLAVLLYAAAAAAQTTRYTLTDGTTVDLPDLIITGSTLNFHEVAVIRPWIEVVGRQGQ